jgi:hypothetical protein
MTLLINKLREGSRYIESSKTARGYGVVTLDPYECAKLLQICDTAKKYLNLELADDPTVADEGCALHDLAEAFKA